MFVFVCAYLIWMCLLAMARAYVCVCVYKCMHNSLFFSLFWWFVFCFISSQSFFVVRFISFSCCIFHVFMFMCKAMQLISVTYVCTCARVYVMVTAGAAAAVVRCSGAFFMWFDRSFQYSIPPQNRAFVFYSAHRSVRLRTFLCTLVHTHRHHSVRL